MLTQKSIDKAHELQG